MSQTYTPSAPATSAPSGSLRRALLATWAALSLGALAFVVLFGTNAPYADEWEFVPVLLGHEPRLPWLWSLHNEHRLPLPRAVYLPLFAITHDFRAGMVLQVALLSALALGLMRLAEALRGRPHWADAFFPLSLLHPGHWENFVMGYQICFVLFTVLVSGLMAVAARATRETAFRSGVAAAVLLLLVALTGGSGLALVPPVAAWIVYLAVIVWRGGAKGRALVLVGLALVPVAYIGLHFVGYQRPADHPPPGGDPVAVASVAGAVLALAPGVGLSGVWWAVCAGELLLGGWTVARLARRGRADAPSSAGLVAVAAGVAGVALAIGLARADWGSARVLEWSRYSLLMWPLLGLAYLAWVKLGGTWVPAILCVAAALALPGNAATGVLNGAGVRSAFEAMEADARAGLPADEIATRHLEASGQRERGVRAIPLLRAARVGIFAGNTAMTSVSLWWWVAGGLVLVGALALAARWLWHLGRAVQVERSRELFRLQHERFEEQLLRAAGATGLPRGLRWVACQITGDAVLVRDGATGGIVALVPVRIDFEPVEGSDMEDVPAAREPRPATAVFTFHKGAWHTAGRVVFNHTPDQTVNAFPELQRLPDHG